MDNFGKRRQSDKKDDSSNGIPANRPSVVNVPPPHRQLGALDESDIDEPSNNTLSRLDRLKSSVATGGNGLEDSTTQKVSNEALGGLDLEVKEARYPRRRNTVKRVVVSVVLAIVAVIVGVLVWFGVQLMPVDSNNTDRVGVKVVSGSTPTDIAKQLKKDDVIRSELVFLILTRLQGNLGKLQAGTYRLSPSESMFSIIDHLVKGTQDTFEVTFLPGATIKQNKEALMKAGYDKKEVDEAFDFAYDSPLFEGKPKDADLEGYIYGDTYKFTMGLPAKNVLEKVFADFYRVVNERAWDKAFKKRGLNLYQGITLASIIQRESGGGDEAQIAQVFYKRLSEGIQLGSDVTYQYIADKTGVARDVNLDSPYNTRRYTGLPPGPIASPGANAMKAVALPADGDYLYFLSGDDDVTYYGRTLQEHEANIKNHCQKKCQII